MKSYEKGREFVKKRYESLLEEKKQVRDCGPRYDKLSELLTHFPTYKETCLNMNDLELLEFITQYISVPLPPPINQEYFDDLVVAGIKEDKKEAIWRLAMNYNERGKDFSKIEDYFILKRDDWYLMELVSGVTEDLNLAKLVDKIVETKDKEFIKKILECEHYTFEDDLKEKLENALR